MLHLLNTFLCANTWNVSSYSQFLDQDFLSHFYNEDRQWVMKPRSDAAVGVLLGQGSSEREAGISWSDLEVSPALSRLDDLQVFLT